MFKIFFKVANEEQLIASNEHESDIERRLLASSRSPHGTLGRFPHPRNNDHPLRFNLRSNPYRFDAQHQQQHEIAPTDDLRTPPPTLRRLVPPPETPVMMTTSTPTNEEILQVWIEF